MFLSQKMDQVAVQRGCKFNLLNTLQPLFFGLDLQLQVDSNDPPRCIEPCYGSDLVTGYGHMLKTVGVGESWRFGMRMMWAVFCFYVSWRATLKDVGARECFEKKAPVWLESLKVFWIKKSGWGFKTSQGVFSSLYCVWKSKRSDLSFHRCSSVCACVMLFGMPFELPVVNPAWNSWVDKHSFGWRTSFSSPSSLVGFGNLLLYSEVGW